MLPTGKNILATCILVLLGYFSWLMIKLILPYTAMHTDTAFLQTKQNYIHNKTWLASFYIHVFSSMLVLVAGFTQFSKSLLKRKPLLHRKLGSLYIIVVLCISGPAGFIMSFYANGGTIARVGFVLLSVLWLGFTALALYKAIKKNFASHQSFMIRSYALTLSAISLRAWKVLFEEFTNIDAYDRYRIIAWLGWGLNLLIAEMIIYNIAMKRKQKLKAMMAQ